ncbi:hypothetical protein ALC62_08827 [Cyphomyrmex costatus]|uniref:Uncharacterized protein n=1 Tax=Cyphomyrmex costatus TaxID=456900 RepID=A0A195CHX5_9HYME|nr:hypothetical protein ALC62_08827 [Cyphomyrmex costatus]
MHHANLPIEIIIKRYLWSRESPRNGEPLCTPASPSTSAYRNLAAPAPFAPSAYNIRYAKIGKSGEGKEDGEGEEVGDGGLRDAVREDTVRKVAASKRAEKRI